MFSGTGGRFGSGFFLFLGLELVLEHYRSRCHALFREDRFDLVAMPVPVAVLSARSLLPGAQQVQGHTVELAQLGQTGECFLSHRRLFILTSLSLVCKCDLPNVNLVHLGTVMT